MFRRVLKENIDRKEIRLATRVAAAVLVLLTLPIPIWGAGEYEPVNDFADGYYIISNSNTNTGTWYIYRKEGSDQFVFATSNVTINNLWYVSKESKPGDTQLYNTEGAIEKVAGAAKRTYLSHQGNGTNVRTYQTSTNGSNQTHYRMVLLTSATDGAYVMINNNSSTKGTAGFCTGNASNGGAAFRMDDARDESTTFEKQLFPGSCDGDYSSWVFTPQTVTSNVAWPEITTSDTPMSVDGANWTTMIKDAGTFEYTFESHLGSLWDEQNYFFPNHSTQGDISFSVSSPLPSGVSVTTNPTTGKLTVIIDSSVTGTVSFTVSITATNSGSVSKTRVLTFTTPISITQLSDITNLGAHYILNRDIDASGFTSSLGEFTGILEGGIKDDGTFYSISKLDKPIFSSVNGGIVRNLVLKDVNINNHDGNTGAIASTATGDSRIYNIGILSGSVGGTGNTGGLIGLLDGSARVINCYSYANITGGTNLAGIVGNNNVETTMTNPQTMVMNCMFYGNITGSTTMKPVYGGTTISNAGIYGVNNYNYYRNGDDVTFDDSYTDFSHYYCSLPADVEYLTRFEYYRSILNSNKKLCTWWINGTSETLPTAADIGTVGIAKWVLDPAIAPYPILKQWDKYPSVINPDPDYVWNPTTKKKVSRTEAEPYQGKKLGTISVTVNAGSKHAGMGVTSVTLPSVVVMDMDTLNHDYCYAKIQLPYYNELFGDPTADATTEWDKRYGGNYKDYVVTGWKITSVSGGTAGSFKGYSFTNNGAESADDITPDETSATAWEDGFNFADRNCTNKDLYVKSGRVFAQGGYYYVPEGVTSITIEAYWGEAVYLHNKDHSLDRVNVASGGTGNGAEFGTHFSPAGTLPTKFQDADIQTSLQDAIGKLKKSTTLTVYDQAIVLVGNVQVKNRSASVGDNTVANRRPFTIMSIDEDMDNEPDYCLEFQFRNSTDRPGIHPIRFDFLPVPELGLAIKTNQNAYAIGVFIPQGHFEITETSFMHTTQFEYDGQVNRVESPIILNGGHFEQIAVRYGPKNKVSYFLMGGHFRMKRFTPGLHPSNIQNGDQVRHCVVNAVGGDFPEFYLSGINKPDLAVNADNPHCYVNGGRFGTIAGAAYEQVNGDVTFKIDHAIIDKFYGGGLNGAKPVTGSIDVTINNTIVNGIYCGGPEVGEMTKPTGDTRKTVTTTANNTIFNKFFGGGNGGTSYYRENLYDKDMSWPSDWEASTYMFPTFNPLNTISDKTKQYNTGKGYHDMFEFEVFNASNGLTNEIVGRTFIQWAQFGTTITGTVTNTLTNCIVKKDFYGGGNLGNVDGDVISTLTNTHVKGSVFGGGFSAEIPRFRMHDVSRVHVPHRNDAGLIDEQGYLDYVQDAGEDRYYRWTNNNNGGSATTNAPTYWSDADGEYKCYTPISLEGLGEVDGSTTLIIDGTSQIDGNVFGGGDASKVNSNTNVTLQGNVQIQGNVFGGGNKAEVVGSATVSIIEE